MGIQPIRFDTIRKTTVHFLNTFNSITVDKFDEKGNITKTVEVPLKLAGKQKFYYWLYDRAHTNRFPVMAASAKSIKPAVGSRGTNQKLSTKTINQKYEIQLPTPYDMEFELSIVTNFVDEANQILEQILPFFQPFRMITINLPEIEETFDVKVILNDVSEDKDFEMPEDNYRTISWLLSFTAHTKLYKPIYDTKIIEQINLNFKDKREGELLEQSKITDEKIEIINYEKLHGLETEE